MNKLNRVVILSVVAGLLAVASTPALGQGKAEGPSAAAPADPAKPLTARQIFRNRGAAVVLIIASDDSKSGQSLGTGSIITASGRVITNNHVIFNDEAGRPFKEIHVFLKPERVTGEPKNDLQHHFRASVRANSPDLDLALLEITDGSGEFPHVELGNSEDLLPGDQTVAIGHPEGGGFWTLTTGAIGNTFNNYRNVKGKDVFQMETSLNRGNSGGPLFDTRGYQVAVNSFIIRKGDGGLAITGVNFALRSTAVRRWLKAEVGVEVAYGSAPLPGVGAETPSEPVVVAKAGGSGEPAPTISTDTAEKANVSMRIGGSRKERVRVVDDRTAEERRERPYQEGKILGSLGQLVEAVKVFQKEGGEYKPSFKGF